MKKLILKTALLACAAVAGNAQALPVAGQGTWETTLLGRDINGNAVAGSDASTVFLYDTVLDVTWLRDANANGIMTWGDAKTWAGNLVVGSFTDWRLPSMIDTGSLGCNYSTGGTDCGYNVQTKIGGTVYSEMASLWYNTLGNLAYPQTGYGLSNSGDFKNLQSFAYWSGLQMDYGSSAAWNFATNSGMQTVNEKAGGLYALAVRYGDVLAPIPNVASPIPEPATYALMLLGLGAVMVVVRRRKA